MTAPEHCSLQLTLKPQKKLAWRKQWTEEGYCTHRRSSKPWSQRWRTPSLTASALISSKQTVWWTSFHLWRKINWIMSVVRLTGKNWQTKSSSFMRWLGCISSSRLKTKQGRGNDRGCATWSSGAWPELLYCLLFSWLFVFDLSYCFLFTIVSLHILHVLCTSYVALLPVSGIRGWCSANKSTLLTLQVPCVLISCCQMYLELCLARLVGLYW